MDNLLFFNAHKICVAYNMRHSCVFVRKTKHLEQFLSLLLEKGLICAVYDCGLCFKIFLNFFYNVPMFVRCCAGRFFYRKHSKGSFFSMKQSKNMFSLFCTRYFFYVTSKGLFICEVPLKHVVCLFVLFV